MDKFMMQAILSGVLFGCWPLLLSRSGLNSSTATFLTNCSSFLFVVPFTLAGGITLYGFRWWIAVIAGCMGGLGCLAFNDMMIKSKPAIAASMFVIMLVIQTMVPAVYHVVVNQQFSAKTIVGFVAGIVACILLSSR